MDFLTDPISITFSVRQGDPLSMVLFLLYIEPLALRLQEMLGGYVLRGALGHGGPVVPCGPAEEAEDYVDDLEGIITSDQDMIEVDKLVALFEVTSGAILNRSTKTKVMGLGDWRGRTCWPLDWISSVNSMTILGFFVSSKWKEILNNNWKDLHN